LHSSRIETIAWITSFFINKELKQKLLKDSGNSCFGIGIYPKYGTNFGGAG
jgi:hypothetical protein